MIMKHKFFTLTLALLTMAFAVNAQKMTTAKQVPLDKQVVQKKQIAQKTKDRQHVGIEARTNVTTHARNLNSKATLLDEDFEGGTMPTGWTAVDGASAWTISNNNSSSYWTIPSHTIYASLNDDAAGSGGDNSDTYLATPAMDFTGTTNPTIEFESLTYGSSTTFTLKASTDGGSTWSDITTAFTSSNTWTSESIDLSSLNGESSVMLAFHHNDNGSWGYGWAVDDVLVFDPEPYQFSVTAPSGESVEAGQTHYYTVSINNTGTNSDDFVPALDGVGSWTYELVDASDSVTALATPITIASGETYDFVVKTTLPATGLAYGDTDTESITVTSAETGKATESVDITTSAIAPVQAPYTFDFADGYPAGGFTEAQGMLADPVEFTEETSAWTQDDFANAGASLCAKLNLYGGTADEWFFTPTFNLDAKSDYQLTFDLALTPWNGATVGTFGEDDIFAVVISTDNGETWTSANALLTYDDSHTFSLNEKVTISLYDYSGEVKFGFYGESTASNEDNDLFIDNITIEDIPANDLALSGLNFNSLGVVGTPQEIEIIVQNNGLDLQAAGTTISVTEDGTEFTTVATTVDLATGESETLYATYTPAATGTYTLGASVPAGDDNTANDELTGSIEVIPPGMLLEDFEAATFLPNGWTETANAVNWGQSASTDFYTIDGKSAYIVHDFESPEEMLITPQLTLDGSITELTYQAFDGNGSYGLGSGIIQVKYSTDASTWTDIGAAVVLDQADPQTITVDLSSIPNGDYYFAFAATSDFDSEGFSSLTSIDNVEGPVIAGLSDNDLAVETINYPSNFVYAGDEVTITAKVKNVGLVAQTGTEVSLVIDGGTPMTANIGTLGYGQSEMVEFTWTATTGGSHTFEASVTADDNTANDSYTMDAVVTEEGMLTEGFEDTFAPAGWTADADWQQWTATWTPIHEGVAGAAAGNTAGFTDAILATPKVDLTGTKAYEELNFYATLGNAGVGAADLDIVYSDDGTTWTEIQGGIVPNETMDLYTIDLSAIPDGQYYLGFRASGSGDGTYATWIVIDHVVAPQMVTYDMDLTVEDSEGNPLDGVTININETELTTVGGSASLTNLTPAFYDYTASKYWYDDATGTIEVADADVAETITMSLATTYSVTFNVSNDIAEPVEGATVSVNINGTDTDLTTNAEGKAYVDLMDGDYDYTASKISHDNATGSISVSGADITEDITLVEHTYTVTFAVDDNDGAPLEGATVSIDGTDLTTDVDGIATIDLRNGTYDYGVEFGFCDTYSSTIVVDMADLDEFVTLTCPDVYSVTFTVDDGTDPLEGATVAVAGLEEMTDATGTAVADVPDGTYTYAVDYGFADTYTGTVTVDMAPVIVPTISLVVPETYTVTFAVTDGTDPLEGATIDILNEDITLTTDVNGEATTMLPEEAFDYEASLDLYQTVAGNVNVPVGGMTEDIVMTLIPYDVTFNVTDGTDPIAGATVTIDGTDYTTDANGEAIATALPPATYDYTVVADTYIDATGTVEVIDQDITEDVTMDLAQYFVTFTVDNENGDLLEGAAVTIGAEEVLTDANGEAEFELIVGDYDYTVALNGYEEATGSISVVDADIDEAVTLIEVIENPTALSVAVDGFDATLSWDLAPMELVQHSGVPASDGGYYQSFGNGYGVIYDLTPYTDAVVSEMDFHHVSWGLTGTWEYKIHVVDWDAQSIVYTTDMLTTTGDDQWEEGIDLNDIEGLGGKNVAILLEPFGNTADDAYPDVNTDGALDGASILGPLDDLSSMQASSADAGDFVMDLWIMTSGASKPVKAQRISLNNIPTAQPKAADISGDNYVMTNQKVNKGIVDYNVFLDDLTTPVATNVSETSYTFTDLAEGTHTAGVQRVYETGVSDVVSIDFDIIAYYAVTFTVTDVDDGTAIEGATVEINGEALLTDADGIATIALPDNDYDYTITMTDYETEDGSITVAGEAVDVAVELQATGINDAATLNFNIYPNPTSGVVYIEAQGTSNVTVLNAIGDVVTTTEIHGQGTIDLSNNASGIYFIRLTSGNKVATQRIIVE